MNTSQAVTFALFLIALLCNAISSPLSRRNMSARDSLTLILSLLGLLFFVLSKIK